MNRDDLLFQKRIRELAERSYTQSRYVFTDFLNSSEQALFFAMETELSHVPYRLEGGFLHAERRLVRFGSEELCGYETGFPIACIKIEPLLQKFADTLSHRDFLGALMNLGITREKTGDIIIKENVGYLFCLDSISEYVTEHLDFVKHTHVKCSVVNDPEELPKPVFREETLIVSSNRADSITAKVFHLSREQALTLFRDKKVSINGRQTENNSGSLKPQDVVSVRGHGKYIFQRESGVTQKNRIYVSVSIYV